MMESLILSNLIMNREYLSKVFPFVKDDYFDDIAQKTVFQSVKKFVDEYNEPPSKEALLISIDNRTDLNEQAYKNASQLVKSLTVDHTTNQEWLLNETEKFCQTKDLYNSIRRSIQILEGVDKELDKGSIPKLLSDSLAITFDTDVGHDYLEDIESRYEYYHRDEERIPFDIDLINKITKGGLPRKSLTMLLATTGAGKSLAMCHFAASNLIMGRNVLYISMEMPEEQVSQRVDANLIGISMDEVKKLSKEEFSKRVKRIKEKTTGRFIVKEYPTGTPHAGHFKNLLTELKQKKNFVPDIIYIDYLNICASSRIKGNAAANSYTVVKAIAEEVRGLGMEFDVPIVSASQLNRGAYDNTDVDLTNTSESMGITHTADCILALITSEELEAMGQLMIKQLKNRWGDLGYYRKFVIGIDRSQMKLFNADQSTQTTVEPTSMGPSSSSSSLHDKFSNKSGVSFT